MKKIILGAVCIGLITTNTFAKEFKDVEKDEWYSSAINYVTECNIFSGESEELFAPNKNMTRAMLVQIIYNMESRPEAKKSNYLDVSNSAWYYDAISWATDKEIVKGVGENKFEPNSLITKEQLITALYNYAKFKNYDVSVGENTNILSYEDAFSLHDYGYEPMQWACGAQIIEGENGYLNHSKAVTRAEVASIMKSFSQKYQKDLAWVKLDGNPTTGYIWTIKSYDKNIVFVDDYKYEENSTEGIVGAPGAFEFTVTGLNPGKTDIVFEYKRPWEEDVLKTVICETEVLDDGDVSLWLK